MRSTLLMISSSIALLAAAAVTFGRNTTIPPAELERTPTAAPATAASPAAQPSRHAPSHTPSRIRLQPADLSTSVGTTPIRVFIDAENRAEAARLAESLVDQVRLELEPEATPVDIDAVPFVAQDRPVPIDSTLPKGAPIPVEPPPDPSSDQTYVEVFPKAPLADRWYRLVLRSVPAEAIADPWSTREHNAEHDARFHPGTAPVLRRVSVCEKAGKHYATAEYSENVSPSASAPGVRIDQPGLGKSCKLAASDEALRASPALYVDYDCTQLDRARPWRIAFREEAPALSGRRAGLIGRTRQQVETTARLEDLRRDPQGCAYWSP